VSVAEHKEKAKRGVGCFVLTVSDTRDETTDQSGQLIKGLLAESGWLLRPGGVMALECGQEQAGALRGRLARRAWVADARTLQDLAGRPRGVLIRRQSARWRS